MRVNVNCVNPDELYFVDTDGARLRGDSHRSLLARIVAYRERRGAPAGNPAEELQAQLAGRNPGLVRAGANLGPVPKQGLSFKGRILTWLAEIRKRKDSLSIVRDSDRNARVNICAGCPHNKPVASGCASCKEVIAESRNEIIGRRAVDKRMGACQILGEELSVSTWTDDVAVENNELPNFCWRRKSI